jgi:hypothetical protein
MKKALFVRIIRSRNRTGGSYQLVEPSSRGEHLMLHVVENPSDSRGLKPNYVTGTFEDFNRLASERFAVDINGLETREFII